MALDALLADDYKVDLEVFEGASRSPALSDSAQKRSISTISRLSGSRRSTWRISTSMRILDLNIAGEFLVMAATLDDQEPDAAGRVAFPTSRLTNGSTRGWITVRQLVEYKSSRTPLTACDPRRWRGVHIRRRQAGV